MASKIPIHPVRIPAGAAHLDGDLRLPSGASAIVVFAHGSGSGRLSPRNRQVAEHLHGEGFATLLLDLLTRDEEAIDVYTRGFRFDIPLLARRMVAATDWVRAYQELSGLKIGYFGASTGAAAALIAAAERPHVAAAVVSRGGRPDLADDRLPDVQAPTLLIVGERDDIVIGLNREAMDKMRAHVELQIVPRATHLFEEPGALEQVSRIAADWFHRHLRGAGAAARVVQPEHWASALEDFGREHRAWLATIERFEADGSRDISMPDRPLAGVFAERQGERVVAVRIDLAPDPDMPSSLRIAEPVAVRLEVEPRGAPAGLEIDERSGGRTLVRFRVHPPVEMLDGVAPGEL